MADMGSLTERPWFDRNAFAWLVTWLSFLLRMIRVKSRPLWYDEAFAILYGRLSYGRMIYGTTTATDAAGAADVHPLLYYFSLHGWVKVFGPSPLAARFFSVVLGMITIALLWRMAAFFFGRRTGQSVGLLGALSPFHVAYSQEARMYALLALSTTLTAWGFLRALEGRAGGRRGRTTSLPGASLARRGKWWGLYALGAALTLHAHNLGAVHLLALHALFVTRRRWWRNLRSLLLADAVALALFSPWLVKVLPGQLAFVSQSYWLQPPGPTEFVRAIMLPVLTFYEPVPVWMLVVGLFTGLLSLVLIALRAWRNRCRSSWFLLLSWVPIITLFITSQWRPLYLERALLPSALFYLVPLGCMVAEGNLPTLMRWGLCALLAVCTIGSLANHYTYSGFPRPPFEEAAAYLQTGVKPGDVVIHSNKLTYLPMQVYAPSLPARFIADPPGSPQDTLAGPTQEALGISSVSTITGAIGTADGVWLVYFEKELAELSTGDIQEHPVNWMETRFVRTAQKRLDGLTMRSYRREN